MKTETVKGFKDFTGEDAQKKEEIRKILVETFSSYGFEPAETPIVEYREFVKGDNTGDEAVSDIFKLEDKGQRKLALRYEFTFQLKRLMKNKKLPYKRYQIGPVFRDEPVSGNRLRQFIQCDVDTVGSKIKDEAEVLAIVKRVLEKLGVTPIIYINNRKLLNEILEKENIEKMDYEKVIKEIDKLDKNPEDEIFNNLRGYGAQNLLKIFKQSEKEFKKYDAYKEIQELKKYCKIYDVPVVFSPSLARGLSYYNGSVFEVKAKGIKETITAGGSFIFEGIQSTGLSFGLDRLTLLVDKLKNENKRIMVLSIDQEEEAIKLAEEIRTKNIFCIISSAKISKALEFANNKKINKVIFLGKDEIKTNKFKIKDMEKGTEKILNKKELLKEL
tara:strand:+ start:1160 stop:2320 length:1161 start_codon:yes stop_codon:yes gene_type:complete